MVEYIVLVIAPIREWEVCLLNYAGWEEGREWSYVAVNTNGKTTMKTKLSEDCLFVLINQCQEEDKIEELLRNASLLEKKIIVWAHKTEEDFFKPFECRIVKKTLKKNLIDCKGFSHGDNISKGILDFMKSFAGTGNWNEGKQILLNIINECRKKKATLDASSLDKRTRFEHAKNTKNRIIERITGLKHRGDNIYSSIMQSAELASGAVVEKPESFPMPLKSVKSEIIDKWLKDYIELSRVIRKMQIDGSDKIVGILKNATKSAKAINDRSLSISNSVAKAFEVALEIKTVCDILSQAKKME